MRRKALLGSVGWFTLVYLLSACGGAVNVGVNLPSQADFVVRVNEERFIIRLTRPDQILRARQLLASRENKVVRGTLRDGNGGYNRDPVRGQQYSWHLDPQTIEFFDVALEVCDGLPSYVEEEKAYWLELGYYCPWAAVIEQEL